MTRLINTGNDEWQKQCREKAQAHEQFEVRGIRARHLAFCKSICDEFHYECEYDSRDPFLTVVFTPIY